MPNVELTCDKMMTIKHQLEISLKRLIAIVSKTSKNDGSENNDDGSLNLGRSYVFVGSSTKREK